MKRITMISFFGCLVAIAIGFSAPSTLAGNKVLSLDGDGDYVEIPNFSGVFSEITVESWVSAYAYDSYKDYGKIIDFGTDSPGRRFLMESNKSGFDFWLPGDKVRFTTQSTQFIHLAGVWKKGDLIRLYINGCLVDEDFTVLDSDLVIEISDMHRIGARITNEHYFHGLIDEVRIWNVARTQEDIQDNMDQPLDNPESEPNLVGYWNFDSGMADDLSQHDNDGTLHGDAYIADVIYVSSEYGSPGGDGTKEDPYDTIQRGINEAGWKDIVQALPGTYTENINLRSDLMVLGSGSENTIITAASGNIVTANNVHNVSLSGFTIDGGGVVDYGVAITGNSTVNISNNHIVGAKWGIRCADSSAPQIENNTIAENVEHGIVCQNTTTAIIQDNLIRDNSQNGIFCVESSSPTIHENTITENSWGIMTGGTSTPTITENHISQNLQGTWFRENSAGKLYHNIIELNEAEGIVCGETVTTEIIGNAICYNNAGFYCNNESNPLISENLIHSNRGVALYATHSSIPKMTRNIIRNNNGGIAFDMSAQPVIGGNLTDANTIVDNGGWAISNATDNTINATFNYWGTTDDTEIAAMIQNTGGGDVKFKPFVTEYSKIVADTSGDGTVSAYDAALILQFVVGLIDTFPVSIPQSPDQTTPRNYIIRLPSLTAHAGKRIQVPVAINNANGLTAGGIILKYDPTVLKAIDVLPTKTLNGSYWKANTKLDGEIRFAFACTSKSGDVSYATKTLFMVEFEVLPNTTGKISPLILDNVQFPENQSISKINGSVIVLPETSMLLQNYPNPFNPETWVPYQLATDSSVMISIYNAKGQLIRVLHFGNQNAGIYMTKDKAAYWDGRDETGEKVASGVYFYTLQVEHQQNSNEGGTGKFISTRRMVILK